jgi:ATP-dependent protease HslVU (ClpYQ) peptidase subunit
MTTIALDKNLVLASDSLASIQGVKIQHPVQKLWDIDGYRVGTAGSYAQALAFVSYLESAVEAQRVQEDTFLNIPQPVADALEEFTAIVVSPEGDCFIYEGAHLSIPVKPPVAIGSGGVFAESSMALGLSAEEAVAHAIKFDVYSAGEIQVLGVPKQPLNLTRELLEGMDKAEIIDTIFGDDEEEDVEPEVEVKEYSKFTEAELKKLTKKELIHLLTMDEGFEE